MKSIFLLLGCVTLVSTVLGSDNEQGQDCVSFMVYLSHPEGQKMQHHPAGQRRRLLRTFHSEVNRIAKEKSSDPEYVQKVKLYWQNYHKEALKKKFLQKISDGDCRFAIETFLINEGYKEDSQLLKIHQTLCAMPAPTE